MGLQDLAFDAAVWNKMQEDAAGKSLPNSNPWAGILE